MFAAYGLYWLFRLFVCVHTHILRNATDCSNLAQSKPPIRPTSRVNKPFLSCQYIEICYFYSPLYHRSFIPHRNESRSTIHSSTARTPTPVKSSDSRRRRRGNNAESDEMWVSASACMHGLLPPSLAPRIWQLLPSMMEADDDKGTATTIGLPSVEYKQRPPCSCAVAQNLMTRKFM